MAYVHLLLNILQVNPEICYLLLKLPLKWLPSYFESNLEISQRCTAPMTEYCLGLGAEIDNIYVGDGENLYKTLVALMKKLAEFLSIVVEIYDFSCRGKV